MKIIITGGSGFIGSNLANFLASQNHQIIIFIRNDNKIHNIISHSNIIVEYVDVTNYSDLSRLIQSHKPDVIFHLAGETSHKKSFEDPMYDIDINTKSTLQILEIIRKLNLKCRFILGSTFIVVGKPEELPVNEESRCNPTTIYGANRLASEHICKIYHDVYGLDTISFRITNCFGPREQFETPTKNALNYLIHQSFLGKNVTIYDDGKFFRDIIFIDDVISALSIILEFGKAGNLYWVSSGQKTWFYEIGELLNELTNTQIIYTESPEYTKKVDVGNFVVDNSKLRSLGWEPKTTIKDGIKKTLEYFKVIDN